MINNVTLMGRITHTPELGQTGSGTPVIRFALAVERSRTSGNEKITDFIDCVAWRQTAEFIVRYFGKGDMIAIVGEIQTRTYDGKDGTKKKAVEIIVSHVSFCGGKNGKTDENSTENNDKNLIDIGDDDLPF